MIRLHHRSGRIAEDAKDLVTEFFVEKLGFRVVFNYKERHVFLRQDNSSVDIQLCAVGSKDTETQEYKPYSHIGFISDTPHKDRQEFQDWFHERGHATETYQGTDKELFLDVPGVFLDFAIEIVDTLYVEELNYPPHDV